MSFSTFDLHPSLLSAIADRGFTEPTPIQADAIPPALAGRDLLACASTGSGKTVAFLLPLLQQILPLPRGKTRALVLTPTRELASQIVDDVKWLTRHTKVTCAAVFGGVGMQPQEQAFRRGVDIIVACPGRLLDHLKAPYGTLSALQWLVLDEADRMLDMGFLPDIRRVLRHIPARRQTLFFSATMPPPIAALAKELLQTPATINVERRAAPATGIAQSVYPVPQHLKSKLLAQLLTQPDVHDALVFTRTKHRADRLMKFLAAQDITVERIHGNRSQNQRTEALGGFKSGKYRVLVATDIAARGIDVTALGHVINFDVPAAPEDYIHRVGRTARAQATGFAITLVAPEEQSSLNDIERAIHAHLPKQTLPGFDYAESVASQAPLEIRGDRRPPHQRHGGRPHPGRPRTPQTGRQRESSPGGPGGRRGDRGSRGR